MTIMNALATEERYALIFASPETWGWKARALKQATDAFISYLRDTYANGVPEDVVKIAYEQASYEPESGNYVDVEKQFIQLIDYWVSNNS